MSEGKLIATLAGGRVFTVQLPSKESPTEALGFLTERGNRGRQLAWTQWEWLDTEEGFRIRRDAVVAYVVGHKNGEWAVAA